MAVRGAAYDVVDLLHHLNVDGEKVLKAVCDARNVRLGDGRLAHNAFHRLEILDALDWQE